MGRVDSLLKNQKAQSEALKLPWSNPTGQNFWKYYLEQSPIRLTPADAWDKLLPLRRQETSFELENSFLLGQRQLLLETFFYPHGLAVVITVSVKVNRNTPLTLEKLVETAFDIKKKKIFVQQQNENELFDNNSIVRKCLTNSHIQLVGEELSNTQRSLTPFTIFTVVEGSATNPRIPISEIEEVHRTLEAVTKWQRTWKEDSLDSLDERQIRIRAAPPSHILYGSTRGRAVWFPALFMPQPNPCSTLSCFHRNLTLLSLQVESLGGLASISAKELEKGIKVRGNYEHCVNQAAGILGRLYGGNKGTYRSWSPRKQIEQNQLVKDVNMIRDFCNMEPLS